MKSRIRTAAIIVFEGVAIGLIARLHHLWPLALAIVLVIELMPLRRQLSREFVMSALPSLMSSASIVLLVALLPRAISQLGLVGGYTLWRLWQSYLKPEKRSELAVALANQFLAFWAIFVAAAIWHWPRLLVLVLVWVFCYIPIYLLLSQRQDGAKTVVAAAWALVAVEVSWVSLNWLVSYVLVGGLIVVPQPAVVLTGLSYCFGSIYLAQREGRLSRKRLSEYVVIAIAIIAIVAAGTNWRGTI